MSPSSLLVLRQKLIALAMAPSERRLRKLLDHLSDLHERGVPYVRLTQFLTRERQGVAHLFDTLPLTIEQKRVHRPLYAEACVVAHTWLQQVIKGRNAEEPPFWASTDVNFEPEIFGWCDGSLKGSTSQIGFVLKKPNGRTIARVTHPVAARDAMEAELTALLSLLETALALGYQAMQASTDAQGVLPVLKQNGVLRFSVLEAQLARAAEQFTYLRVTKVHRLFNYEADRLAACNFIQN